METKQKVAARNTLLKNLRDGKWRADQFSADLATQNVDMSLKGFYKFVTVCLKPASLLQLCKAADLGIFNNQRIEIQHTDKFKQVFDDRHHLGAEGTTR